MPLANHVPKKHEAYLINQLNIRSADRGRKDIATWRSAQIAAESVYYPNRCRLYDLYEDVILDGHLAGIISKRIDNVLNKPLFFEHRGERIPQVDALINTTAFRDLIRLIMETQLWGISGIEFIPGPQFNYQLIPRKHIKPELGIIAYEQNGTEGIPYALMPNVWVMGRPRDLGLLLKCAPYYLYKRAGIADWAQYIELFGQPVRVIKYDAYDEQTKQELRRILDESGSSLSIMLPKQADFEMKDGKSTYGDGNLQMNFIQLLNEEMSILLLGNTETTRSSNSSGYAQSKVHRDEQFEITRSDLVYTANMLNSPCFLSVLRSYGYPVDMGRFVFDKETDIQYLKERLAIDKELAEKVPLSKSYWYDTYGIPEYFPDTNNS
jgi:hypothetical protein